MFYSLLALFTILRRNSRKQKVPLENVVGLETRATRNRCYASVLARRLHKSLRDRGSSDAADRSDRRRIDPTIVDVTEELDALALRINEFCVTEARVRRILIVGALEIFRLDALAQIHQARVALDDVGHFAAGQWSCEDREDVTEHQSV